MSDYVFHFGGHAPVRTVEAGVPFSVFTEDCFSGKLTSTDGEPRIVAPYPRVNPLTGPIALTGIKAGEILAVHLIELKPARNWGVATISPNFGLLSGNRGNPNLQAEQAERVWIWKLEEDGKSLSTPTLSGPPLSVPFRPFHGTVGVAPAHGEVRLSVVPGDFGGNLDLPMLGGGTTLYLKANVDGADLYIGDGHFVQGDGEIAGTAIEGALDTTLVLDRLPADALMDWPRIETDAEIGVIGAARPLEDAARIASAGLIRWVADACGLDLFDAQQLVTQICRLKIGNLVNPLFTVACTVPKALLPAGAEFMGGAHARLRAGG
ncbi:acetamidase/formamidase family protein [Kaistia algarum]|uniref:acetamidase/formamidase family protein n=1 Tax=Kaistia algarum TaxID=2083279 RepID=UPI001402B6FA|nr:acetamidase/formamidase family protein [Kaistia algarum]MCX5512931.1 acetamidase/formamidase family protein [Kaistia algarum]